MPGYTGALLIRAYFFPVKPVGLWAVSPHRQAVCLCVRVRARVRVWVGV